MNLLIVNPNTSEAMTEDIRRTLEQAKSPDVSVTVTGRTSARKCPGILLRLHPGRIRAVPPPGTEDGTIRRGFDRVLRGPRPLRRKRNLRLPGDRHRGGLHLRFPSSGQPFFHPDRLREGRAHDGKYGHPIRDAEPVRRGISHQYERAGRRGQPGRDGNTPDRNRPKGRQRRGGGPDPRLRRDDRI